MKIEEDNGDESEGQDERIGRSKDENKHRIQTSGEKKTNIRAIKEKKC